MYTAVNQVVKPCCYTTCMLVVSCKLYNVPKGHTSPAVTHSLDGLDLRYTILRTPCDILGAHCHKLQVNVQTGAYIAYLRSAALYAYAPT